MPPIAMPNLQMPTPPGMSSSQPPPEGGTPAAPSPPHSAPSPAPAPPSPAPEAPPPPAPPTPPSPAPAGNSDPFGDLANYAKTSVIEPPPKPPTPPAATKPAAAQPPAPAKSPEDQLPPDFRKGYNELKTKYKELQAEYERMQKGDPEKLALKEKLTRQEERLAALDKTLRETAWERSEEFALKYDRPLVDAYNSARSKVSKMRIADGEGEVRQATAEDFDRILNIPDPDDAAAAIEEMFGTGVKATQVTNMRDKIIELNEARFNAQNDFQANFQQREKARMEQERERAAKANELWEHLNAEAINKYPQWFAPKEDDQQWNDLLRRGYERADMAFTGASQGLPMEEAVRLHNELRNKAAAFGPLAYWIHKLKTENDQLKQTIAQYEASAPGQPPAGAGAPGTSAAPQIPDIYSGLDTIAKEQIYI